MRSENRELVIYYTYQATLKQPKIIHNQDLLFCCQNDKKKDCVQPKKNTTSNMQFKIFHHREICSAICFCMALSISVDIYIQNFLRLSNHSNVKGELSCTCDYESYYTVINNEAWHAWTMISAHDAALICCAVQRSSKESKNCMLGLTPN